MSVHGWTAGCMIVRPGKDGCVARTLLVRGRMDMGYFGRSPLTWFRPRILGFPLGLGWAEVGL